MKILLSIIALLTFASVANAAPITVFQHNILPEANDTYELGSTTPAFEWLNLFVKNVNVSSLSGFGIRCLQTNNNGVVSVASAACGSGGGGGGGTFSTTTSTVPGRLTNYPNNTTDIVVIGDSATTTGPWWYDPNTLIGFLKGKIGFGSTSPSQALSVQGNSLISGNLSVSGITATGTLTFPANSLTLAELPTQALNTVLANATANSAVPSAVATSTFFGQPTPGSVLAFLNGIWIGAATTTFTSPLLYSAGNVTCQAAASGVTGCLSGTDWTTFNSKVGTARALTVAGTANQITSSAGSQDLSADRTWTLSLPAALQLPLSFTSTYGTTTFASSTAISTTNLAFTNATSTNLAVTGSSTINTLNLASLILTAVTGTQCLHAVNGTVSGTGSDCGAGGSGGMVDPFTHPLFGQSATTSTLLLNGGFTANYGTTTFASSTALSTTNLAFTNGTSTNLAVTGSSTIGTLNLSTFNLVGVLGCSGSNALTTNGSGVVACGPITATGGVYPFTPGTFGTNINTSATSTIINDTAGFVSTASSTLQLLSVLFGTTTNATSTNMDVSGLFTLGSNAPLSSFTGTGLTITAGVLTNSGVTSNVAGNGISVSGSTGAVTITNTIGYPFTPGTFGGIFTSATTSSALSAVLGFMGSSTSYFDQIKVGTSTTGLMSTSTFFGNLSVQGNASSTNLFVSSLVSGNCVQASTGGLLTTTGSACGAGAGGGMVDPFTHPLFGQSATTSLLLLNGNASSTQLSVIGPLYIGTTSTTTIMGGGNATSTFNGGLGITTGGVSIATVKSCNTSSALTTDSNGAINCGAISGSGTVPGGSNGQIQYNNSNAFGGVSNSTFSSGNWLSFGTSTLALIASPAQLVLGTSTAPQLLLTDNSNTNPPWYMRNVAGNFFLGTSSPSTFATSSFAGVGGVFEIDKTGNFLFGTTTTDFQYGTTTATSTFATSLNVNDSIVYNAYTGTTSISQAVFGPLFLPFDGGNLNALVLPLSQAAPGTLEAMNFGIGTSTVLAMFGSISAQAGNLAATSTAVAIATTTSPLNGNGVPSGVLELGTSGSTNGTTTISMGKIQYEGYDATGTYVCTYIVGTSWVLQTGKCNH